MSENRPAPENIRDAKRPRRGEDDGMDEDPQVPPVLPGRIVASPLLVGKKDICSERLHLIAASFGENGGVIYPFSHWNEEVVTGDLEDLRRDVCAFAGELDYSDENREPFQQIGPVVVFRTRGPPKINDAIRTRTWGLMAIKGRLYGWALAKSVYPLRLELPQGYSEIRFWTKVVGPVTDKWAEEILKGSGAVTALVVPDISKAKTTKDEKYWWLILVYPEGAIQWKGDVTTKVYGREVKLLYKPGCIYCWGNRAHGRECALRPEIDRKRLELNLPPIAATSTVDEIRKRGDTLTDLARRVDMLSAELATTKKESKEQIDALRDELKVLRAAVEKPNTAKEQGKGKAKAAPPAPTVQSAESSKTRHGKRGKKARGEDDK